MDPLNDLVAISRFYGDDPDFVIAGGGNTSFKDGEQLWIKASGIPLAGIGTDGFVCLSRQKLRKVEEASYSEDPRVREEQVKKDITGAVIRPINLRPSVETSLHNLIDSTFVVHTHPTVVNGLLCSKHAEREIKDRFGDEALYVEYTDPGYVLFRLVREGIREYREKNGRSPGIIFLQNHGVFVGADTTDQVKDIYQRVFSRILEGVEYSFPSTGIREYRSAVSLSLENFFSTRGLKVKPVVSDLILHYAIDPECYLKVAVPFTPDVIVYCKSNYLFMGKGADAEIVESACLEFKEEYGYFPRVILEEGAGMICVEENAASQDNVISIFSDQMKVSFLSEEFGGPHFMTPGQIRFIDQWEVENYRRKVAREKHSGE